MADVNWTSDAQARTNLIKVLLNILVVGRELALPTVTCGSSSPLPSIDSDIPIQHNSAIILHDQDQPIAWCKTIVHFQSATYYHCDEPGYLFQNCHFHPNQGFEVNEKRNRNGASVSDSDTETKEALSLATLEFKEFCEKRLSINVRADCPFVQVHSDQDLPPCYSSLNCVINDVGLLL